MCLIYHINPDASWSGGAPVTGEDFAHTVALEQSSTSPGGYSLLSAVEVLDDDSVRVVLDEPFGGWQDLFGRVFRAGRLAGDIADVDTTGPFQFVEWAEGEFLRVERDRDWWADDDPLTGDPNGDVQEITFVFIETLEQMVNALEGDEIDVFAARPDAATVESLTLMEDVEYTVASGPFWEHIDFNHDDPLLSQLWAREAISTAIDREKILDRTVRLVDPDARPLDNTVWMTGTPNYEPVWDDSYDPERADEILVQNGCERGDDGIQVCGEDRMSFVWASTNDDPSRREIFESVREDLAVIGIELVADFVSPSVFVTREFLFGGPDVWQMVNFSWRARPEPIDSNPTYYCDDAGDLNVNGYCSEEVDRLIRSTESIVDQERRAEVYNQAVRTYLDDRAVIPLFQKPLLMAWTSELDGPEPNYTLSSDLWNVASWSGKESIVVALPAEPKTIDPLTTADDSANVIMSTLLYGAFGMSPSHERLPVLVDSVELIEGGG